MKELTYELLSRAIRCASDEAEAVVLQRHAITSFGDIHLKRAALLSFPHNRLKHIESLYECFPSVWWLDVSFNQLTRLVTHRMPFALGWLNIRFDKRYKLNFNLKTVAIRFPCKNYPAYQALI